MAKRKRKKTGQIVPGPIGVLVEGEVRPLPEGLTVPGEKFAWERDQGDYKQIIDKAGAMLTAGFVEFEAKLQTFEHGLLISRGMPDYDIAGPSATCSGPSINARRKRSRHSTCLPSRSITATRRRTTNRRCEFGNSARRT